MTGAGKKVSRRIVAAGFAACLLLAAILLAPRLVRLEAVRGRIETAVTERTGARVRFGEATVRIFPRPRIVIRDATVAYERMVEGKIAAVAVTPMLLPLLKGEFRPAEIRIERPVFRVELAEASRRAGRRIRGLSGERIREEGRRLLAAWGSASPGLAVSLERGELLLLRRKGEPISFTELRARLASSRPGTVRLRLACASNLWENFSAEGSLEAADLHGAATVSVKNFLPGVLPAPWLPGTGVGLGGTIRDLVLAVRTEGMRSVEADAKAIAPSLTVRRGDRTFGLKGVRLDGAVRVDAGRVVVSVARLLLDTPEVSLSGRLSVERASRAASLSISGGEANVRSVRIAAMALLGDLPPVRKLFGVLEAGNVSSLAIDGHGDTPEELTKLRNLRIRGRMRQGALHVPRPHLRLEEVDGEAVVDNGILTASNASARSGRSRGTEGSLRMGLVGPDRDRPFRLKVRVAADLSGLPALLERLVRRGRFPAELTLLEGVEGSADGSLDVEKRAGRLRTRVDVTSFALSCRYRRVPFPLTVRGGTFHYDEEEVRAQGLSGTAGGSSFSGVGGRVALGGSPSIEAFSGSARIDGGGIYSWLSSLGALPQPVAGIRDVRGSVNVSLARLEGPAADPKRWRFDASGSADGLHAAFLDSAWTASGTFEANAEGPTGVAGAASGNAGPEAVRRISSLLGVPPEVRLRPPVVLHNSAVSWTRGGATSFRGTFDLPDGRTASIDLRKDRDSLTIRKVQFEDGVSRASLSLERRPGTILVGFSGALRGETIDKVLADNPWRFGSLGGDFRARIVPGDPGRSTATGNFHGTDIAVPWKRSVPLKLLSVALTAGTRGIRVHPSLLSLGGRRLVVKGDLSPSGDLWLLDTDATAEEVDWDGLKELFAGRRDGPEAARLYDLPVRGKVRLRIPFLKYGGLLWSPFHAELSLAPSRIDIRVVEAALCGVSFPGSVAVTPQTWSVAFRPARKGGDVSQTISCLGTKNVGITGTFDLESEFAGSGKEEALEKSIEGKVEFAAKKGRIDRMTLLAKVFALLNVTEIFRGKVPDLAKEGFPYDTLNLKGTIREGKLHLKEIAIEGSSLEIFGHGNIDLVSGKTDLELVVAPFRTADSIIRVIPLLRYVLGGTLVSIPVRVSGNIADPDVAPFSPTAVGSDLLGLIRRTLKVPFRIIQPLLPEGNGK